MHACHQDLISFASVVGLGVLGRAGEAPFAGFPAWSTVSETDFAAPTGNQRFVSGRQRAFLSVPSRQARSKEDSMHDIDRTQHEYGESTLEYGETGFETYGETPL